MKKRQKIISFRTKFFLSISSHQHAYCYVQNDTEYRFKNTLYVVNDSFVNWIKSFYNLSFTVSRTVKYSVYFSLFRNHYMKFYWSMNHKSIRISYFIQYFNSSVLFFKVHSCFTHWKFIHFHAYGNRTWFYSGFDYIQLQQKYQEDFIHWKDILNVRNVVKIFWI